MKAFPGCSGCLLVALALAGCGEGFSSDEGNDVVPIGAGGAFGGGTTGVGENGEPLRLRELRTAARTPPAISGGTLAVDKTGHTAVVADSDRDLVFIVDLTTAAVRRVQLPAGSEPGRVALDARNGAHVALRATGKLVRVDLETASVVAETAVCTHPRGVAFDAAHDSILVACLEGQLVTLEAGTHRELERKMDLPEDLRDVIVGQTGVESVTRYRSAELLRLGADRSVKSTAQPPKGQRFSSGPFAFNDSQSTNGTVAGAPGLLSLSPALAWRALRSASGNVWMLHQQAQDDQVVISSGGGYGSGGCSTITSGQMSEFDAQGVPLRSMSLPLLGLSVDAALSPNGKWLAVASPGAYLRSSGTLQVYATDAMAASAPPGVCSDPSQSGGDENQTVAVAFDDSNVLYAFSREPAELQIFAEPQGAGPAGIGRLGGPGFGLAGAPLTRKASIPLDLNSVRDTGHDLFHADVGQGLACASCHGEALDDGHVWNFEKIGPRRTQTMRGGLLATAPFHWDGDMMNINHLVDEVMTRRMGGFSVQAQYASALGSWIDRQPALTTKPVDAAAVERGKTLFAAASTQCSTCHSGKNFTNNQSKDVGTGAAFQVPGLLGLSLRAPYMHDGCAKTLEQRFEPHCGGGDSHGKTSKLSPSELADLVAYLKTL